MYKLVGSTSLSSSEAIFLASESNDFRSKGLVTPVNNKLSRLRLALPPNQPFCSGNRTLQCVVFSKNFQNTSQTQQKIWGDRIGEPLWASSHEISSGRIEHTQLYVCQFTYRAVAKSECKLLGKKDHRVFWYYVSFALKTIKLNNFAYNL